MKQFTVQGEYQNSSHVVPESVGSLSHIHVVCDSPQSATVTHMPLYPTCPDDKKCIQLDSTSQFWHTRLCSPPIEIISTGYHQSSQKQTKTPLVFKTIFNYVDNGTPKLFPKFRIPELFKKKRKGK